MKNLLRLLGIVAIVAVIGFTFISCGGDGSDNNNNNNSQTGGGTWEPANTNIPPMTGTRAGNAISFTYEGSPVTLTRNGGGDSLDGQWFGTLDGDNVRFTVSGSNWTMAIFQGGKYVDWARGTVAGTTDLTIIITHMYVPSDSPNSGVGYPTGGVNYPTQQPDEEKPQPGPVEPEQENG